MLIGCVPQTLYFSTFPFSGRLVGALVGALVGVLVGVLVGIQVMQVSGDCFCATQIVERSGRRGVVKVM